MDKERQKEILSTICYVMTHKEFDNTDFPDAVLANLVLDPEELTEDEDKFMRDKIIEIKNKIAEMCEVTY